MKLGQPLSIFGQALQSAPGTPVVALDAAGKPVAFGLHLSTDPATRDAELRDARHAFLDNAAQFGKYARVATASLDTFAALYPTGSGQLAMGSTAIAFVSNGVGLAAAVKDGDDGRIIVKSIAIGLDALSLAQQYGLLGQSPALKTAIVIAKNISAIADLADKPKPSGRFAPSSRLGALDGAGAGASAGSAPEEPVFPSGPTTIGGPKPTTATGTTTEHDTR